MATTIVPSEMVANAAARISRGIAAYFFRPGGLISIAICRVALFTYLLTHVVAGVKGYMPEGADAYLKTVNSAAYYPKGLVWLLFPGAAPPAWLIDALIQIAAVTAICAIVGLATRMAMIVAVLASCFLGALIYSWEPLWSHPYNSGLLAGLGFMFGRAGDAFSLDSLIARHVLRHPVAIRADAYWWPVILGMFGTSAVYLGGFYAKWSTPDWSFDLSWVFSDNLRNSMSLPWLIWGRELPAHVGVLVNTPWLWKLAAFGHIATQLLPTLAMLSLASPWWRLAEGGVFVAGVVLLKVMMGFWNPHWIVLAAFFVDWGYFLTRVGVEELKGKIPAAHRCVILVYCLAFITINLVVIVTRLDDRGWNRAYPFSAMTFYSSIADQKPFGPHKHYAFNFGELIMEYPGGKRQKWFCYPNIAALYVPAFGNGAVADKLFQQIGAIEGVVNSIRSMPSKSLDCSDVVDTSAYDAIDLYASVLSIPPYPEDVRFDVSYRALVGRYERSLDRVIAAAGGIRGLGATFAIDVASRGLSVSHYGILIAKDPWENRDIGALVPVAGSFEGQTFTMDRAFYQSLATGRFPIVIRVYETTGRTYDFFGGILYR